MEHVPKPKRSEYHRLDYRVRMLPEQLERAYRRVESLQREARMLKMDDLIRELQP